MSLSFADFRFPENIRTALDEAGYTTPTPIQEKAIPHLREGRDLIGVAQTGTGKTLAFLLPILETMKVGEGGPQAVVICPTRELALQVAGEATRFGAHLPCRVATAYGGTSSGHQKQALAAGCELLVATPGRLFDFMTSAWLSLRKVRHLVLDEADRMLDMGFIRDIDAILRKMPLSRQTMLFSATFPDEIRDLTKRYMYEPVTVRVDAGTRVKDTVEHVMYQVAESRKTELLIELLRREKPSKTLIFTATKAGTSELARRLRAVQHEVVSLSSLLSQANRERALSAFRRGEFDVLVATDVAARGLDITDIDLVVNFDVPMFAEEYVHRIGRTGRAERSGRAVTLVCGADRRRVAEIERLLGAPVPKETLPGFAADGGGGRGSGRRPTGARKPKGAGRPPSKGRGRARSGARRGKGRG